MILLWLWNFSFTLRLTDVPYPPILQSNFTRGCSSINVTWSPPAREALGGLITGYLAQIRKARSEEPWSNCTAFDNSLSTNCLFKHLKPNAKYDVQVIAKNKLGYGWPSEILEASTNQAGIKQSVDSRFNILKKLKAHLMHCWVT